MMECGDIMENAGWAPRIVGDEDGGVWPLGVWEFLMIVGRWTVGVVGWIWRDRL